MTPARFLFASLCGVFASQTPGAFVCDATMENELYNDYNRWKKLFATNRLLLQSIRSCHFLPLGLHQVQVHLQRFEIFSKNVGKKFFI